MFPFKGQVVGLRSPGGGSLTWGEVEAVLRGAQNTLRSVRSLVRKGLQGSNEIARVLQEGAPKHPHRQLVDNYIYRLTVFLVDMFAVGWVFNGFTFNYPWALSCIKLNL